MDDQTTKIHLMSYVNKFIGKTEQTERVRYNQYSCRGEVPLCYFSEKTSFF